MKLVPMKKMLSMTTALAALGTLAACGNDMQGADNYDDNADNSAYSENDQSGDMQSAGMDEEMETGDGAMAPSDTTRMGYNADPTNLTADQRTELEERMANATTPTIEYNGDTYLTRTALNARDVTGADVIGQNGDMVATVDDVIVDANGTAQMLVLSSGGFLGLGDKQITVNFADASIEYDDSEAQFVTSLTDTAIDNAAEFEADGFGTDVMMVSEILGDDVMLGSPNETASVHDLVMNADGETQFAILSTGLGSERYIVNFSEFQPGEREGQWMISMSPDRLQQEDTIAYL